MKTLQFVKVYLAVFNRLAPLAEKYENSAYWSLLLAELRNMENGTALSTALDPKLLIPQPPVDRAKVIGAVREAETEELVIAPVCELALRVLMPSAMALILMIRFQQLRLDGDIPPNSALLLVTATLEEIWLSPVMDAAFRGSQAGSDVHSLANAMREIAQAVKS